ncbi:hypothetical protein [Sinorhizobium sp. BJ1]|uniref:hypothetical protein n=1 Tax=Sinorhizobium sp. BJ1 TaxID=2035455 RepID=UPI0011846C25|nr:hypothetical protein [Sinorhizobium sp. BJ1]
MICPGEAHHIIPDMVYRLGGAPVTEAERNSTAGRIPDSPTYNQGQAICLSTGMHRTDEDAVHKSLNPALAELGKNFNPQGTAPLGKIRDEAHKALDRIKSCPKNAKNWQKKLRTARLPVNETSPAVRRCVLPDYRPGNMLSMF